MTRSLRPVLSYNEFEMLLMWADIAEIATGLTPREQQLRRLLEQAYAQERKLYKASLLHRPHDNTERAPRAAGENLDRR